jgi:S-adenosyl methyltransferase
VLNLQARALPPVTVHIDTPSHARVYDYFLGGTTNWVVDREFGANVLDQYPLMRRLVLAHRLFLNRVVRHLMRRGIRQFLDVGSGVPAIGATHQVADEYSAVAGRPPRARVVYADNDPVAVAHGELLLDNYGDPSRQVMIEADIRDPVDLWQQAVDTELLDPTQPVGLLLVAILHLKQLDTAGHEMVPDAVTRLRGLLPTGSHVAISHVTDEDIPDEIRVSLDGLKRIYDASGSGDVRWRCRADIEALLGDLRPVDPGWISAIDWRPEATGPSAPAISFPPSSGAVIWAGVGEKV